MLKEYILNTINPNVFSAYSKKFWNCLPFQLKSTLNAVENLPPYPLNSLQVITATLLSLQPMLRRPLRQRVYELLNVNTLSNLQVLSHP